MRLRTITIQSVFADEVFLPWKEMAKELDNLSLAVKSAQQQDLMRALNRLVSGFKPK